MGQSIEFTMKSEIITGRDHSLFGLNCQDSLSKDTVFYKGNPYLIGVVADGCGEGNRSETGSHLATSFLTQRMKSLIIQGFRPEIIVKKLYGELIRFLGSTLATYNFTRSQTVELSRFIKDHLLFTVLGFIIGPKSTFVFAAGDGVVQINDVVDVRDQANKPAYPSYHLLDTNYLGQSHHKLSRKFDLYKIRTHKLNRLAIGSDAWSDEPGALRSIWDGNSHKNLQRYMNLLSRKQKSFTDDASLIVVERQRQRHESLFG